MIANVAVLIPVRASVGDATVTGVVESDIEGDSEAVGVDSGVPVLPALLTDLVEVLPVGSGTAAAPDSLIASESETGAAPAALDAGRVAASLPVGCMPAGLFGSILKTGNGTPSAVPGEPEAVPAAPELLVPGLLGVAIVPAPTSVIDPAA